MEIYQPAQTVQVVSYFVDMEGMIERTREKHYVLEREGEIQKKEIMYLSNQRSSCYKVSKIGLFHYTGDGDGARIIPLNYQDVKLTHIEQVFMEFTTLYFVFKRFRTLGERRQTRKVGLKKMRKTKKKALNVSKPVEICNTNDTNTT